MVTSFRHRAALSWLLLLIPGLVGVGAGWYGPLTQVTWKAPTFAFASILVITALCLAGATAVTVIGWRHRLAEVAILGGSLAGASALPMVHGLTVPGVLYGPNPAVMVAAFGAVPFALAAAAPLIFPMLAASRAVARSWRAWTTITLGTLVAVAMFLLIWPAAIPAPTPGAPLALAAVALSLAGAFTLAARQHRLYRIGRRRASLVASVGFAYLGLSTLVWLGTTPFSLGWWLAHAADAIGVLGAVAGLLIAHRADRDVASTLAPVINRDPLVALELGLTPVVHRFVAALAQKDPVTRDHVVRVAELAMRTGVRAGLAPEQLRPLGLGALLHDVGKLNAPDAILLKPGALTDAEFDHMKQHPVWGARLMESSPLLAPAAHLVRWHHERADGHGYPDGLPGDQIPMEASLISVCDAWDAMTSFRPYREGMPPEQALAILHEEAGRQWNARAVDLVVDEILENGPVAASAFDHVGAEQLGRPTTQEADLVCVCLDALPAALRHPA